MANIEKHPKRPLEQLDQADFSEVPTRARSSHLIGRYIKNHRKRLRSHVPPVEERKPAILLRVEDLPATPSNLERVRERIQSLNRRLAESDAPFRLRVV